MGTRRIYQLFFILALAVVLVAIVAGCGSSSTSTSTSSPSSGASGPAALTDKGPIVVASWGGEFTAATKEYYAEPFTAETGVQIQFVDSTTQVAQLQAQQESGTIQWDVLDSLVATDQLYMAKQGWLAPLPANVMADFKAKLPAATYNEFGFSHASLAFILGYNKQKFPTPPTSVMDVFDTQKFPGPRSLSGIAPLAMFTLAELENGVPRADTGTTPLNLTAATDALAKIKPNVKVWWTSGDQGRDVLRDGEVDMSVAYNGRLVDLARQQPDKFGIVWTDSIYEQGLWGIVKQTKHLEASAAFLQWIVDHPDAQAKWAEAMNYGVPSPEAYELMPPLTAEALPEYPPNFEVMAMENNPWAVENLDAMNAAWKQLLQE